MQIVSAIFFDPSTGVTSAILTNTDIVGPKNVDNCPLIVINIPPVLNENGQQAIVRDTSSIASLVFRS